MFLLRNTNVSFEVGFESGTGCEWTGGLQEPISGKVQTPRSLKAGGTLLLHSNKEKRKNSDLCILIFSFSVTFLLDKCLMMCFKYNIYDVVVDWIKSCFKWLKFFHLFLCFGQLHSAKCYDEKYCSPSRDHSPFSVKVLMSPPSPEFKVKLSWEGRREDFIQHWLFDEEGGGWVGGR